MQIRCAGLTETGPVRQANEDALLIDQELGLFVVCDGMGGAAGGQKAAELALETVRKFVTQNESILKNLDSDQDSRNQATNIIRGAILYACSSIHQYGKTHPEYSGMGTTLTLLLVRKNVALMGHVGDSRLYLYRRGELHQLSNDHTVVQEMVDHGLLSAEKALQHPHRHVLSRSLGVHESVQVDTLLFDLLVGDSLLLASDGMFEVVPDSTGIAPLLAAEESPDFIAQQLIRTALTNQSSDNATAIVLQVGTSTEAQEYDERHDDEVSLKLDLLRSMYLFQDLDLKALIRLVEHSVVTKISAGAALFEEGDIGDAVYLILHGSLEVIYQGKVLAALQQGNHVGEMSLLDGSPRTATVKAKDESTVLQLGRDELISVAREDPMSGVDLLLAISRELSSRLRIANSRISALEGPQA